MGSSRNRRWLGPSAALIAGCAALALGDEPASVAVSTVSPPYLADVQYLAPANMPKLPETPKKYRPARGFGGYKWGDPRAGFSRLPVKPVAVSAAWTFASDVPPTFFCRGTSFGFNRMMIPDCTTDDIVRNARFGPEGSGFHVLTEYLIEGQGFRSPATGVLFYPVVYEFCAHWKAHTRDLPENFDELNKFCGVRMLFDTESRSQLAKLPADHVTRLDLVLAELMSRYGKPAGFFWHGRVTIEPLDGMETIDPATQRKFSTWRWCPAPGEALQASCMSSIILSVDPEAGRGVVLFATPPLWEYAYARETGGSDPDPLFTLLHALQPKEREALRVKRDAERKAETDRRARVQARKEARADEKKAKAAEKAAALERAEKERAKRYAIGT